MKENDPVDRKQLLILLSAIFLISFSLIGFEIALSRFLSVLLSYHYVFVVLSLALLGLGMGGMLVHFFRPRIPVNEHRFKVLAFLALLFSLAVSFSIVAALHVGSVSNYHMDILFYGFVLLIPFLLAGMLLAEIYRIFPAISARIYGADLIGAAAGALGAIVFLNILGGMRTHFVLGVIGSLAAVLFSTGGSRKSKKLLTVTVAGFLVLSLLLGLNVFGVFLLDIPIGANPKKEIHDALSSFNGKIIETRWSAFGRTDVIKFEKYPDHMDIYIDGTAGSPMYRFNGDINDPGSTISDLKSSFPGYFPFVCLQEEERNSALVIGPGGGRDILLALMGGVQEITAVEINNDLVELVRKYSWFNGKIYTGLQNVDIIVDEGRNFLKRRDEHYDIIMLSLPVTNTSRSLEGYSLTENFLFTEGSISDYLDHLTPEGRLMVVAHNDAEILRLLSISLAALDKRGVIAAAAMKHVYIAGSDEYLVFVLKKAPFEQAEAFRTHEAMRRGNLESLLAYFPYIRQPGAINPAFMALASGKISFRDLEKMVREKGYDISPVTDNNPFFYKFEVGIPGPVSLIFWSSVILFGLIVAGLPVYWRRETARRERPLKSGSRSGKDLLKSTVLFSMLGTGFMLIEISLIQKFTLFLGQPVLSLAILLIPLLGGAGMGSLWSGRFSSTKIVGSIAMTSMSIVGMVIGYSLALPLILSTCLGFGLVIRSITSVLIMIPLGFLIGIPFPLGIRWLSEKNLKRYIPWMWGINGVSSVLGSVMTVVIALSFGFTESFLAGAVCYLIAFLVFFRN